jgi:DNA (cytosine-5)-methyltransferase 1
MRKNLSLLDLLDVNRSPWVTVRDVLYDLPKPVHRGSKEIFPNHIQHPGARVYQNHIGSFWDYPAKALKAGTHGTPGGENMLRFSPAKKDVRYFTTREAARLHSFPDTWIFHGTWGACIRQLGNAVPVKLSEIFATEIHKRLNDNSRATVIKEKHEQKKRGRHHSSPTNPASLRRD